jgi:hypothetical protein
MSHSPRFAGGVEDAVRKRALIRGELPPEHDGRADPVDNHSLVKVFVVQLDVLDDKVYHGDLEGPVAHGCVPVLRRGLREAVGRVVDEVLRRLVALALRHALALGHVRVVVEPHDDHLRADVEGTAGRAAVNAAGWFVLRIDTHSALMVISGPRSDTTTAASACGSAKIY